MGICRRHTNSKKCFPKSQHLEMLTLKSRFQMLTDQLFLARPSVTQMSNDVHLLLGVAGRHWIWGEKGGNHRGQPKCAHCELRSFLVIGEVEKVNGVLYKQLRLVRSFLVIGEEEKIICTVWYA